MNEAMKVYLNLEGLTQQEKKRIIQKMDSLLLGYGVKYSGTANLYIPVIERERDEAFYMAKKALAACIWLRGIFVRVYILDRKDVCPLEEVDTRGMKKPSAGKYNYYEQYYFLTGRLPHAILVDEERRLRQGYISYLLSRKYGVKADIQEAFSSQPCRKIVVGRHVTKDGNRYLYRGDRKYVWVYSLREPVIPGDILRVEVDRGRSIMCVEDIGYLTGERFCTEHKDVVEHMGRRVYAAEDDSGAGKEDG